VIRPLVFIALFGALAAVAHHPSVRQQLSMESLSARIETVRGWVEQPWGAPLLVVGLAAAVLLHLPMVLVVAVVGLVCPFTEALVYAWVGCVGGASLAFLCSRCILRDSLRPRLATSALARFDRRLAEHGLVTVTILRLFLFMAAPLNWWIGATRIRARDYLIGTAIGITPGLVAILALVRRLGSIGSVRDLLRGDLLVLLPAVGAMLLVVVAVRRRLAPCSTPTTPSPG